MFNGRRINSSTAPNTFPIKHRRAEALKLAKEVYDYLSNNNYSFLRVYNKLEQFDLLIHKKLNEPISLLYKRALEKINKKKIKTRFAMFTLKDSKPGEPLLLHDEPIYLKDQIIGKSTSGNYSFNFKKNLTFGYINNDYSNEQLKNSELFIEVEKKKYEIEIINQPLKQTNFKNN